MNVRILLNFLVALAAACSFCLFAAGCGSGDNQEESENITRATIRSNRELWRSRNLSTYRYTLRINAFLPPDARGPVVINVRDGVAVSVRPASSDTPFDPASFESVNTIDKLFDRLESAADRNAAQQNHVFDPENGHPSSAYIDYDFGLADEEFGFTVTDFSAAGSDGSDPL